MNIVSRSPKTWPYAQSSAQDSVGQLLGTLHPGLLGDILCWEAKGEARRLFESDLKKAILDYLREHSDKAQESGSYLSIPLFMVGKRAKRAKPLVMFVSDDKVARKEAFDLIVKSDIMTEYPGFELGHSDFEKLMAWAGETASVFTAQHEDASGCYRLISHSSDSEQSTRIATAGGAVSYKGRYMLLTVSHFLKDSQSIELPAHKAEASQISDCEITGLDDFDDDDDDDTDPDFVETTRRGSLSDVDESEVDNSDGPFSASESDGNSPMRSSISMEGLALPENVSGTRFAAIPVNVDGISVSNVDASCCETENRSPYHPANVRAEVELSFRAPWSEDNVNKLSLNPSPSSLDINSANADAVSSQFLNPSLPETPPNLSVTSSTNVTSLSSNYSYDQCNNNSIPPDSGRFTASSIIHSPFISIPSNTPNTAGGLIGQSKAFFCAKELDYALMEVNSNSLPVSLFEDAISLEDFNQIESGPRKATVRTVTVTGGAVRGVLSEETLTVRLPQSKKFVEVYTARFLGSLGPGDCGSWVRDEVTGRLFGHVFAGNLANGLTAIMPARLVFEHARVLFNGLDLMHRITKLETGLEQQTLPEITGYTGHGRRYSTYGALESRRQTIKLGSPTQQTPLPENVSGNLESTGHENAEHVGTVKKYICRDPAQAGIHSELTALYPLHLCKACSSEKKYDSYYNAAAHLRRLHFRPRPRLVLPGGSWTVKNSGKDKELPDWPPMSELRAWFQEILVKVDEPRSLSTDEDVVADGYISSISDYDPSDPLEFLRDSSPSSLNIDSANSYTPLSQLWNYPSLPELPESPPESLPDLSSTSSTGFTGSSSSYSYNRWDDNISLPDRIPFMASSLSNSSPMSIPPYTPNIMVDFVSSHGTYDPRPSLLSSLAEIADISSKLILLPPSVAGYQSAAPNMSYPTGVIVQSSLRRKTSRLFCNVCNDYRDGFRGEHELERHMRRHDNNAGKNGEMMKRFICRDPASVGIQTGIQAIHSLSGCETCQSQKQYSTSRLAIAHLWVSHFRDTFSQGKTKAGGSLGSPLEELKAWCFEVQVDKDGRILPEAGGANAEAENRFSDMDCDNDNEDAVMSSDVPESSNSTLGAVSKRTKSPCIL